jgi:hypothetical protein
MCMPFANCDHLFANYVNSSTDNGNISIDYTDFSTNSFNKYDDYANTPDD